ncbi:MAG: hypothetical protein WD896_00730 [Parcubacteria group bacterium]
MGKNKIIWIFVLVLVILGIVWLVKTPSRPGKLDTFASCLKDSGAIFYGAFWCPHCQNQKAMFGSSAKLLPYTECSTPDSRGRLPICTEAQVESYPTWQFADGTRQTGEVSLGALSEATGCPLPENNG